MPLTVDEIIQHPGFQNVIHNLNPTTRGTVAVAHNRGGPINIAYEVHGSGPTPIIWIMGLGAFKWYWQHQMQDFGHDQKEKYSCLIFDNRGMGESDKPLGKYSTSEMARDALELLDHLGWTATRDVHVVGISMGGMIAQEMAYLEPERIASLSLVSTAAELINTIGYFKHLQNRISIFLPKSPDAQMAEMKSRTSATWLLEPDEDGLFPTNGDRFGAQDIKKRQDTKGFTRKGFVCQALAVASHKKSTQQLEQIVKAVGGERIQIMHGTTDNLITYPHANILYQGLGGENAGVTKTIFEERGHYLPLEERTALKRLIEAMIEKTNGLASTANDA